MDAKIGHWAFIVGILLAIIAGLIPTLQTSTVTWILVILGLVVGLLNISAKETTEFLIAVVALLIVGSAGAIPALGGIVLAILANVVALSAPAALIVALKAIYALAAE
jgi:hypothetical protein